MGTAGQLFEELVTELGEVYSREEAINIMRLIFQEKLGLSRTDLALNRLREVDDKSKTLILQIAGKLLEGQPVQQIIGSVHFMNLRLRINKNVLIPRPETEELVQFVLRDIPKEEELSVLDIGTGSGCIAIALKNERPECKVAALDISQGALELAQINAIANNAVIDFLNLDILNEENWKKLRQFDIMVSNPPYVPEGEKRQMHINVVNHEPHIALFVRDDNPLLFYEKIADMGLKHLNKNGRLYFETHYQYAAAVKKLLIKKGYAEAVVKKDINGRDRMVRAVLRTVK